MLCMPIKGLSMIWRFCSAILLAGLMFGAPAFAQAPGNPGIVVTDSSGTLRYRIGDSEPRPLAKGQAVPIGARVTTKTILRGVDSNSRSLPARRAGCSSANSSTCRLTSPKAGCSST
jgi:hypothetical protein